MKKIIISLYILLISLCSSNAQNIAIVDPRGNTTLAETLEEAIDDATSGSTIYLPGGGFQISDDVKITKRLTLMGISHKADSENEDANTVISGNLNFAPNSDGSAIMGIYLSGNINIGFGGRVENVVIKYNNINSIQVQTDSCPGIIVNQNYIRSNCEFRRSNVEFSNNICQGISGINGGTISYNILCNRCYYSPGWADYYNIVADNSYSMYNVGASSGYYYAFSVGVEDIGSVSSGNFSDIFENWQGISTNSNVHIKDTYEGDKNIGVHGGGTGFSIECLPPMPHIVSATIAEQTDAQGKLSVRVKIKASNVE